MLLAPQCIITNFMEAGNDKLSTLPITCSARSPPIPRLRALRRKLCQTPLQRASPAAVDYPTPISSYRKVRFDDSRVFYGCFTGVSRRFTGVHDNER